MKEEWEKSAASADLKKMKSGIDQFWLSAMKFGEKMGCHQKPERSFFIKGYQFPVCARCAGVFAGYLTGLFACRKGLIGKKQAFLGCLVMFLDWLVQAVHIKDSTNLRRFMTGILGGVGLFYFWRNIIGILCKNICGHCGKRRKNGESQKKEEE